MPDRLRRSPERAQVLPMVAIVLVVLITFTSIALDLGYQRLERRDMQAVADVVALDLSRLLDGRTGNALRDPMRDAAAASGARNDHVVAASSVAVVFGDGADVCKGSGDIVARCLTVEMGTVDPTNRVFTPLDAPCNASTSPTCVPTAVRVWAGTDVDYFFRPGSGDARRSAVAQQDAQACFRLGSFAAAVNSGNALLLNTLIGNALRAGVVRYDGLATSSFTLGELASEVGAGSVDELLNTEMTLSEFYLATAEVLNNEDPPDTANATLLQTIATSNSAAGEFAIGDLLSTGTGGGSAVGSEFNVFDVVAGSAFVANGSGFVGLPGTSLNAPGLANFTSQAQVISGPSRACGRAGVASASNSQLTLNTAGTLANASVPVPGVATVAVATGSGATPVRVSLSGGNATGTLASIICGAGTLADPEGIDVSVLTALLSAAIQVPLDITFNVTVPLPPLNLPTVVNVRIVTVASASTTEPAASTTAPFRMPPDQYDVMKETGSGTVGLSGLAVSNSAPVVTATVAGVPLSAALQATLIDPLVGPVLATVLSTVVNPLITSLDAALLGPLSSAFGINIAGADVAATLPEIDCLAVQLVG